MLRRDEDLRPHRLGLVDHQRQESMGRAAGDDLQRPAVLQLPELAREVEPAPFEDPQATPEMVAIVLGQPLELRLVPGPMQLLVAQFQQHLDVPLQPVLQQRIAEHAQQRRRERHRQPKMHPVIDQAIHHVDQWNISFAGGFEEPVLLHEAVVFGMADVRQVGVEDEGELSDRLTQAAPPATWEHVRRVAPGTGDRDA